MSAAHALRSSPGRAGVLVAVALAVLGVPGDAAGRLPSCGQLDDLPSGPLAGKVGVRLEAPSTARSNDRVEGRIRLRSLTGSDQSFTSGIPTLAVAQRGEIVGMYLGAQILIGLPGRAPAQGEAVFAPGHTPPLLLAGCPREPVDPSAPDRERRPLPPGNYSVVALVHAGTDDGRSGTLASAPVPLRVLAP